MHFSRQLAVFINAGIPILDALEVITEETSDHLFKKALSGRHHWTCGRATPSPRPPPSTRKPSPASTWASWNRPS